MAETANGDATTNATSTNDAGAGGNSTTTTTTNANSGTAGTSNSGDSSTQAWDPSKELSKEQWDAIYASGRFKTLNEKAKQADQLQKEKDEAERKQLEEQGKWQELANQNAEKATKFQTAAINAKIEAVAATNGSVDPAAVAQLLDKSGITIDDSMTVSGVEDAIAALKESKPYLFNNDKPSQRVGSGTNPGNANNQGIPKFTHSQIRDPQFFKEHEADIMTAFRTGQIVDDTAQ